MQSFMYGGERWEAVITIQLSVIQKRLFQLHREHDDWWVRVQLPLRMYGILTSICHSSLTRRSVWDNKVLVWNCVRRHDRPSDVVLVERRTLVTGTSPNPSTICRQIVSPPLRPRVTAVVGGRLRRDTANTEPTSTSDPPPAKQVRVTVE